MASRHFELDLHEEDGTYRGLLFDGGAGRWEARGLALGSGARLRLGRREVRLGRLARAISRAEEPWLRRLGQAWQVRLGRYLYRQVLAPFPVLRELPAEGSVLLRIVCREGHLERLPWVLLRRDDSFLSTLGWAFAITESRRGVGPHQETETPPYPRLLIATPQPRGESRLGSQAHAEDLERLFAPHARRMSADAAGRPWARVHTWEELQREAERLRPQIFYFYGHQQEGHLIFEDADGRPRGVPNVDVHACLKRWAGDELRIAYLNCCHGDAIGTESLGRQLGRFVPAVISNRTLAATDTAREQARLFWGALLAGQPPHAAFAHIFRQPTPGPLSFADSRWMTPVLRAGYRRWAPPVPRAPTPRTPDGWRNTLDRERAFAHLRLASRQLVTHPRRRSLFAFWLGGARQGLGRLHRRLGQALPAELGHGAEEGPFEIVPLAPEFPCHLVDPDEAFRQMLAEALGLERFAQVAAHLRTEVRPGARPLLHLRLGPFDDLSLLSERRPFFPSRLAASEPAPLARLIDWWDRSFASVLRQARAFAVVGISFRCPPGRRTERAIEAARNLEHVGLRATSIRILEPIGGVPFSELRDFLGTVEGRFSETQMSNLLAILYRRDSTFEDTIAGIDDLMNRPWKYT